MNEFEMRRSSENPINMAPFERIATERRDREMNKPENIRIRSWFETQAQQMDEMEVGDGKYLNDEEGKGPWKAIMEEGRVEQIFSSFFSIRDRAIGVGTRAWHQPTIVNATEPMELPSGPNGEKEVDEISGFLGAVTTTGVDQTKRMLLAVTQEPFMKTEGKTTTRTLFQSSRGKLKGMKEGTVTDEHMSFILPLLEKHVTGGQDFLSYLETGKIPITALAPADSNRIDAQNLAFEVEIPDEQAKEYEKNGKYLWASKAEVEAFARAGLINGHARVLADYYLS